MNVDWLACAAALAHVGCMVIYPDPELPDIQVAWYEGDCRTGDDSVRLSLAELDDLSVRAEETVPCSELGATFVNVPRARYRLLGALLTSDGSEITTPYEQELDMRSGLDQSTYFYFGAAHNVRITWTFADGATCESLGAQSVDIDVLNADFPDGAFLSGACDDGQLARLLPDGLYSFSARARSDQAYVAASRPSPNIVVSADSHAEVDLVLSPCGPMCP